MIWIITLAAVLTSWISFGESYVLPEHKRCVMSYKTTRPVSTMFMVDPVSLVVSAVDIDVGIAVASAAVGALSGAASQLPKMLSLQRELESSKAALAMKESDLVKKISELEDTLFLMDQEYEAQTSKFKKEYDNTMRVQISELTAKLKSDFEFKYQIKLEQEKSTMLSEKLKIENNRTNRAQEVAQLNIKTARLEEANAQLNQALKDAELELKRIKGEKNTPIFKFWK